MTRVQYVFWDSDNTLVDTAEHHWRKHFETLKKHDIALGDQYRRHIYENNGVQNWEWLTEELGLSIPCEDYLDEIDGWYIDHIGEINVRPGIAEALDYFEGKNIPQAVVSNGRRRSVMAALEAKDISPRMKFILCKEDYEGRKPDPSPYLTALRKMEEITGQKIDPAACLVIEDDPLGVQAGKAAGMQVLHRPMGDDSDIVLEPLF
ncbi:MAG: HAD family phosphatase [Rhodospirillales bacterium]|nr:HAD family phosphatase [Alphaproteobacteria bacterium]USO03608.1 MAG: HAD family phosphatase [Rhodospirillales bacterium]